MKIGIPVAAAWSAGGEVVLTTRGLPFGDGGYELKEMDWNRGQDDFSKTLRPAGPAQLARY